MPLNAALRTEPLELVPYGLLATRPWLMERGIALHAVDNLVKSGQLIPLRLSVYVRPGSRLVWQGIVCSLQRMCDDLVVGGTTVLELHGRAHHLPLTRRRAMHLYGPRPLPPWINGPGAAETFHRHGTAWLSEPDGLAGDEGRRSPPSGCTSSFSVGRRERQPERSLTAEAYKQNRDVKPETGFLQK